MSDFIEEVEDRLRAERYRDMAFRLAPWFIAALVAVVVGWLAVWGWRVWQDRNIGRASVAYDQGLTALGQGDPTGAFADFQVLGKTGPAGYRALALIQLGNIRLAAGKGAEAAAFYDQAARAAPNRIIGDLARLKAALALLDGTPYPQLQTRLSALIGAGKPFDLQAREALAMAKLAAGKTAEARGDFNALTLSLGVSQDMSQRARTAMAVIDSGQAAMATKVAAAAATLPPPSQENVPPPGTAAAAASQGPPETAAGTPQ